MTGRMRDPWNPDEFYTKTEIDAIIAAGGAATAAAIGAAVAAALASLSKPLVLWGVTSIIAAGASQSHASLNGSSALVSATPGAYQFPFSSRRKLVGAKLRTWGTNTLAAAETVDITIQKNGVDVVTFPQMNAATTVDTTFDPTGTPNVDFDEGDRIAIQSSMSAGVAGHSITSVLVLEFAAVAP